MLIVYGISNCTTVKKARQWLADNNIGYNFHDYRIDGVDEKKLNHWIEKLGWELLLNKRSLTWRSLSDNIKSNIDRSSATQVMLEKPTIIKRPLTEWQLQTLLGFQVTQWENQCILEGLIS